ncbi:hypothetical protein UFOVP112_299 [uncultured Caudovirales phage]|uniref:Uncharacterized protein n=1 Tax=uncultured Caudovirales phage TaxID=2100421 RepID=A0A6J5L4I2_9CAUD|nr:hypothetical protein UFOVP112_299 [uncultured Caudovirales phage]
MHSNFITPPDYVETVLILNATEEQVRHLGMIVQDGDVAYNVYFYNEAMDNQIWFNKISIKADVVLDAKLTNPLDYFNK